MLLRRSQPLLQLQLFQLLDQQIDLHIVGVRIQSLQLTLNGGMVKHRRLTPRANLHRSDTDASSTTLYLIEVLRAYLVAILAGAVLVHVPGRGLELGVQLNLIINIPPFLLLLDHLLILFKLKTFIFFVDV